MNTQKSINIDFLYLDTTICTRCQDTETNLDDSLNDVAEVLNNIGFQVKLNKIHIETKDQAIKQKFVSSPTIRVNGHDIQIEVVESHCSTCSSLTNDAAIDCRVWNYNGKRYSAPPKELIIDRILKDIYQPSEMRKINDSNYVLPKNLREYFLKKDQLCANVNQEENSACCDATGCC